MADLRPDLAPAKKMFGAAAVVTRPGQAAVTTIVIVLSGAAAQFPEALNGLTVTEQHRAIDLTRADVPTIPTGTTITVSEGTDAGTYAVDGLIWQDGQMSRALVHRA
ncbi:MAG TPA: hypothetical protein VGV13_13785 [Methylomirabilota bacterium]|jgi:hypothetical protein|nr:hypothetical protein [Methylomirabilota bacterium]